MENNGHRLEAEVKAIKDKVNEIESNHLRTLEGKVNNIQTEVSSMGIDTAKSISDLTTNMSVVATDVTWLKKFFFLVASSSIGGLVVALYNLITTQV